MPTSQEFPSTYEAKSGLAYTGISPEMAEHLVGFFAEHPAQRPQNQVTTEMPSHEAIVRGLS